MEMLFNLLLKPLFSWAFLGAYDLTAVQASTHARIEKKFQDNLMKKTPLLMRLKDQGGMQLIGGGTELSFPVIVDDGNAGSYQGDDVLNIGRPGGLIKLTYNWKQFYSTVRIDGLEEIQNAGEEQAASVLDGRFAQAETTTANKFEEQLFGDGTGNGSKDFNGLQAIISETPTTGTVGGQSRATYSQLQNQVYSTAITGFNTSSAGRIGMTTLWADCVQGTRKPNFIVTTSTIWGLYQISLTTNERFLPDSLKGMVNAGFAVVSFMDAPVTMSAYCPAGNLYMLRIAKPKTDGGLSLVVSRSRNFKLGKFIEPTNQDFVVAKILTAGELICDAPYLQGVIASITG